MNQIWDFICSFVADRMVLKEVVSDEDTPRLIEALSTAGGKLFGQDFNALLRSECIIGHTLLSQGYASAEEVPDLDELLSLFWDCLHLKTRMYDIHAQFKPSAYAGQDRNAPSIIELSRSTTERVWAELVDNPVEFGGDDSKPHRLNDELVRMEALAAAMRTQLDEACASLERY